ncbi:hypothetical protein Cyagr_0593 [Cyanobium gracile PCC 6307]|uniref:Calcium-binding protein n=2 Tax=Cyanobium gracile TaxID=59930 RepID=K9P5E5_CYAGP|nr:hypothetical protein Cyagr_0593 [Cyanobium gracile PCC 6307]
MAKGREMSQAVRHLRRAINLRSDSGRLSLESVLTGTALWLALLYLMQDGAMAAGPAEGERVAAGPAAVGGGPEDTGSSSDASGDGTGASPQGAERSGPPAAPVAAGVGVGDGGQPPPGGGAGGWITPKGTPEAAASPSAGPQEEPGPGSRSMAASSSAMPLTGAGGADRSPQDPVRSDRSGSPGGTSASETAEVPSQKNLATEPEIPAFRVVLRSNEGIVSRSVEGVASTRYHNTMGTITDAVIDLRDISTPKALVSSDRQLQLLALSVLNDADLTMESQHTGLNRARLLFGPEVNDIRLQVSDDLVVGLVAGGAARGQILQSLIGMLDSRLEDTGGGGTLELSSLARVLLKAPGDALNRQLGIDLLAQAMQNSTILLGDGDDRVTITSGFRDLDGPGPGLLIDIPAAGVAGSDPSLQLQARALGLVDSSLDTGRGNDQVSIETWLDQGESGTIADAADHQRIALLNSTVRLGDGDDLLNVVGAVIGSRIDLGTADNQLTISDAVQDSEIILGPNSTNRILLPGAADNSLSISLAPGAQAGLNLQTGDGDDRILLPLGQVSGSVDGGGGGNTLQATAPAALQPSAPAPLQDAATVDPQQDVAADPLRVSLSSPGEGTVGSLAFRNIDNLHLGSTDVEVSVAAQGELSGTLAASGGHAALDYSAWEVPVQVDLAEGEASGILGGISGFSEVSGGSGDDQLRAGQDTLSLDGGPGDDTILLNLASGLYQPGVQIFGGEGRDTFVLSGLEAIQAGNGPGERALPVLADLKLQNTSSGGIGLTDSLAWRQEGIQAGTAGPDGSKGTLITLTPSGLEGLGQPRLVPIAPLEQLLAGIHASGLNGPQLAIAAGATDSTLLQVEANGSYSTIAALPSLRLTHSIPAQTSATLALHGGLAA